MQIFAFLGPARCGKTTASQLLEQELKERGYHVERLSFAAPIKAGCARLGITKEDQPDEYRALAQRWGKTRRDRNPDHWIRKATRSLNRLAAIEKADYVKLANDDNLDSWCETIVIIDDVRYQNEVDLINERDGVMTIIDPGKRLDLTEEFRQHESEALANRLVTDQKYADNFIDEVNGWCIPNNESEEQLELIMNFMIDQLWFGSIWSIT